MPSIADLDRLLRRLDGKGYGAGKQVVGRYADSDMLLWFTYAPADKFAPPGRLIIDFGAKDYGYPSEVLSDDTRRVCLAHFLSDLVDQRLRQQGLRLLRMDAPRQAVLRRTSVHVEPLRIQLRLGFHYEAAGRRILGRRCAEVYCERLPSLVRSIAYQDIDGMALANLIRCVENQRAIRELLPELGLVGFVGDGSILPRQGNTDQPLAEGCVPFEAPESLEVSVPVPHGDDIRGLGIAEGRLTCISGANFQGKTTLLEALGQGIYDHVPGDGRELVVCLRDLAFANKENKRVVTATDITPFISHLPGVGDCKKFTSSASSGSTSQAACIVDAVEAGMPGILIDEDDSAVNLLVKDNRLKRLVPGDIEPIRPLIDTIKSLPREHGMTPVMVVGALGEFTEIADTIVMMHEFKVEDATHRISEFRSDPTIELMQEVSERLPQDAKEELGRAKESARQGQLRGRQFGSVAVRRPRAIDMGGRIKVRQMGRDEITISVDHSRTTIDLRGDIQKTLVEDSQVRALGDAVVHATRLMDGESSLAEVVRRVCSDVDERGLDCLSRHNTPGQRDYAEFTPYQLFYVLSRYPAIQV
jgi:predicted ABC-class ATPase